MNNFIKLFGIICLVISESMQCFSCKAQNAVVYDNSISSALAIDMIKNHFIDDVISTHKYDSVLNIIGEDRSVKRKHFEKNNIKISVLQIEQDFTDNTKNGYITYNYAVLITLLRSETGHGVKLVLTNNYLLKAKYIEFFDLKELNNYQKMNGTLYFIQDTIAPWRHFKSFKSNVILSELKAVPQFTQYID